MYMYVYTYVYIYVCSMYVYIYIYGTESLTLADVCFLMTFLLPLEFCTSSGIMMLSTAVIAIWGTGGTWPFTLEAQGASCCSLLSDCAGNPDFMWFTSLHTASAPSVLKIREVTCRNDPTSGPLQSQQCGKLHLKKKKKVDGNFTWNPTSYTVTRSKKVTLGKTFEQQI